jgi:hypothetical protein
MLGLPHHGTVISAYVILKWSIRVLSSTGHPKTPGRRHVEALPNEDADQQAADVRVVLNNNGTTDFGGDHNSTSTVLAVTGRAAALQRAGLAVASLLTTGARPANRGDLA